MATKIQAIGFLREHHSAINLDVSLPCRGKQAMENGDSKRCLQADIEKARQMILEHECIFRSQLKELHRLYARQKELMNELKRREANRVNHLSSFPFSSANHFQGSKGQWNGHYSMMPGCSSVSGSCSKPLPTFLEGKVVPYFPSMLDTRSFSSREPWTPAKGSICPNAMFRMPDSYGDTKLSLGAGQTSQCNVDTIAFDLHSKRQNNAGNVFCMNGARGTPAKPSPAINLATKDFFKSSRNHCRSDDCADQTRFDKHPSAGDFCSEYSQVLPQRKRKLFGVEIDEYNNNPSEMASKTVSSSWIDKSFAKNLKLGANDGKECSAIGSNINQVSNQPSENDHGQHLPAEVPMKDPELTKAALPWFLRNSPESCHPSKEAKKSPYFMNLDSLQNCSQKFFRKTETADTTSMQKKETVSERSSNAAKILGFPISEMLPQVENRSSGDDPAEVNTSGDANKDDMKKGINSIIDLNLSLDEEALPSAPFLPTAIVKIVTTEIDLEAPAVIESETDAFLVKTGSSETYLSPDEEYDRSAAESLFAISLHRNSADNEPPPVASTIGALEWFVEIVYSQQRRCGTAARQEFIPDGMDHFEYETLKLEETKEEPCQYEVVVMSHPTDEEMGNTAFLKRSRRRGRPWKNFQKDILPGMIMLSRLEVAEDLQTFDELMKAGGGSSSSRSSTRHSRGRKRAGPAPAAVPAQQPNCQMEDRSLTGWGKRTRRLPRQRCHNASYVPCKMISHHHHHIGSGFEDILVGAEVHRVN
ncbi:uncharacterized protein LOC127244557 [Andrographis paniculata]|uniref:uncharacterized protein LOC127244557 n=1 Tax=Andrographis paniculata TaxID=175694 RepID=UPI0021E7A7CC|nr:uncharacterized protein LOC127244557 [Andrographis paniculata]XP_051121090.1 uncharacterized protein LOC127244557 [Andrographis paniculata]